MDDKVLLVTGGSRGIGAATCRLAARAGWTVVVNYTRHADAAQAVVTDIEAAGARALAVPADVADETQVLRLFDINVIGSLLCAREAVRRMSTRHGGRGGAIVNLSSAAARLGAPGQYVDYAAAKGAIDSFTIGLAKEVAGEGIRVNAVRPGIIDTEIHASGGQPHRVRDLSPQVPMQRGGTADEVAQAIVWLLSDAASYATMGLLDVSGGR